MGKRKRANSHRSKQQPPYVPLVKRGYHVYLGTLQVRPHETVPNSRILVPGLPSFRFFGDESTGPPTAGRSVPSIITYGLVILNESYADAAERALKAVIARAEVPPETGFHAREVLNDSARENSVAWRHVSEADAWTVAEQLIKVLRDSLACFCIGVVHCHTFPHTMPYGDGSIIPVKPEHFYGLAFAAATTCAAGGGMLQPNFKQKLWVNQQTNVVKMWGCGGTKVERMYRFGSFAPEIVKGPEPILLSAADLISYVAARALSEVRAKNTDRCKHLYDLLSPVVADAWWQPDEKRRPEF